MNTLFVSRNADLLNDVIFSIRFTQTKISKRIIRRIGSIDDIPLTVAEEIEIPPPLFPAILKVHSDSCTL